MNKVFTKKTSLNDDYYWMCVGQRRTENIQSKRNHDFIEFGSAVKHVNRPKSPCVPYTYRKFIPVAKCLNDRSACTAIAVNIATRYFDYNLFYRYYVFASIYFRMILWRFHRRKLFCCVMIMTFISMCIDSSLSPVTQLTSKSHFLQDLESLRIDDFTVSSASNI